MTAFRDTIFGKILGTVGKVVLPIVSKVPIIGGIVAGAAGMIGGLVGNIGAKGETGAALSQIAANAVSLTSGLTAQQNDAMAQASVQQKLDMNNLAVFNKLLSQGVSRDQALVMSGLGTTPTGGLVTVGGVPSWLIYVGLAVGGFAILKVLKIIK